jgi:hypothetical protein
MRINEETLIEYLKESKKAILLEPNYRRKYPPLGLAKIATFLKANGTEVIFQRSYKFSNEDLVCVTSLFTYHSKEVLGELSKIRTFHPKVRIILGGIYASLNPDDILKRFPDVDLFVGYSKTLDMTKPDYSIDWGVEEPWDKFSFIFTTRGCPNKCAYCAVWRIEPERWTNPKWKEMIDMDRPNVMVSDNNLSSQSVEHIADVCNFLSETKRGVVLDNGVDCKHITEETAALFAKMKFVRSGMRLAFDRIEEDGRFQKAVETLIKAGVKKSNIMAYVLFNFMDTPKEAIYRAEECVRLGIRPYPQMYAPLNKTSADKDKFIGKYWTEPLTRVYRFFFLMAGYYTKSSFMEWLESRKWEEHLSMGKAKSYNFTEKEMELLNFEREKGG